MWSLICKLGQHGHHRVRRNDGMKANGGPPPHRFAHHTPFFPWKRKKKLWAPRGFTGFNIILLWAASKQCYNIEVQTFHCDAPWGGTKNGRRLERASNFSLIECKGTAYLDEQISLRVWHKSYRWWKDVCAYKMCPDQSILIQFQFFNHANTSSWLDPLPALSGLCINIL